MAEIQENFFVKTLAMHLFLKLQSLLANNPSRKKKEREKGVQRTSEPGLTKTLEKAMTVWRPALGGTEYSCFSCRKKDENVKKSNACGSELIETLKNHPALIKRARIQYVPWFMRDPLDVESWMMPLHAPLHAFQSRLSAFIPSPQLSLIYPDLGHFLAYSRKASRIRVSHWLIRAYGTK